MGVWSPAFQHKFLDGNLLNFAAAPGLDAVVSFEAPIVRPTPPLEELGFPVRRGNRFSYQFNHGVFDSVIGAAIKIDIVPPVVQSTHLTGEVVLGSGTIRLPISFDGDGNARMHLIVDGDDMEATVPFDPGAPFRIQARWHTHGQGQLWVNGQLRSYEPAISPGKALTIDQVSFGHPDTSSFAPSAPAWVIRQLVVKLLRDDDGLRVLDQLHPIPEPLPLDLDCRIQLANFHEQVLTEMRALMRPSIASLTQAWKEGQPGSPFSRESVLAHGAAVEAGRAFVQLMIGHPDGQAETVSKKAKEFLALIRATDPAAYDAAIDRLKAMPQPLDSRCIAQLQPFVQAHSTEVQPLADLLAAVWTAMQSPTTP